MVKTLQDLELEARTVLITGCAHLFCEVIWILFLGLIKHFLPFKATVLLLLLIANFPNIVFRDIF